MAVSIPHSSDQPSKILVMDSSINIPRKHEA